jgi:competence protein ComEA
LSTCVPLVHSGRLDGAGPGVRRPSVGDVLFTTTRRTDRETQVRGRLAHLIKTARAEQAERVDDLPADQRWIDESEPAPVAPPPADPWWRRGPAGRLVERWLPGGAAVGPRRRLSFGLVVALAVGAAVTVGVAFSSTGGHEPSPELPAARASPDVLAPAASTRADGRTIVVSVVGRVVRPGLVTLPDGARVADALAASGGPEPGVDVSALNIARRLTDGEQIYVGIPAPPEAESGPGPPEKVDLNAASVAQLDTLPGVGAVTAQRIVDWRTQHGRFTRVEQLREVDGIGPARFGQLKDLVVVR